MWATYVCSSLKLHRFVTFLESATGLRLMRDPSTSGKTSTILYVSSYSYIRVLMLLYMCPHTAMYVFSYCYVCVIMLIYMCPHTATLQKMQRKKRRACVTVQVLSSGCLKKKL